MHVKQLIIVAGPSCVGKTTLVKRIQEGGATSLSEQLGIDDPYSWNYVEAAQLSKVSESFVERMIVLYGIKPYFREVNESVLGILNTSDELTILTLFAPAQVLLQRMKRRDFPRLLSLISRGRFRKSLSLLWRIRRRRQVYVDQRELLLLFDKWIEFCDTLGAKSHWVMNTTGIDQKLVSSSLWQDIQHDHRGSPNRR